MEKRAVQHAPATEIAVSDLRQCLIWPLIVADPAQAADWFDRTRMAMPDEGWREVAKPLDLPDDGAPGDGYEEAVYFHDFVRDFLYDPGSDNALFRRPVTRLSALIDGCQRDFAVDLCTMRLHRSGVAVLTLDLRLEGDRPTLAEAQTIIDHLRRAYPSFWRGEGQPGLTPLWVELDGKRHELGVLGGRASAERALRAGDDRLSEPLFNWWAALLQPLTVEGAGAGALRLRQVLDERIPLMTTLSLSRQPSGSAADLERVRPGDWHRIGLADEAGDAGWPYNPDFLARTGGTLFYDRFAPHADSFRDGATQFLFAGYHFAAIGAGEFFDKHVVRHMRRHYRQMMTLCVLEFATLLMISSQLSAAAKERKDAGGEAAKQGEGAGDEKKFREMVLRIQKAFLDFTHRAHFTGVSNQLQAREMFERLRGSMGLGPLYEDVRRELDDAARLALAFDQRDAAEEAGKAAAAAQGLTEVATVAAFIGLVAGIAGMNLLVGHDLEQWAAALFGFDTSGLPADIAQLGVISALVALPLLWLSRKWAGGALMGFLYAATAVGVASTVAAVLSMLKVI